MIPVLKAVPFAGVTVLFFLFGKGHPDLSFLREASLVVLAIDSCAIFYLGRRNLASPIHWGMSIFLALAAAALWVWPEGAGRLMVSHAATLVYIILLAVAVMPLLLGKEVFTMFFARKQTPETLWGTSVFIKINHHLTGVWAMLFFFSSLLTLVPGVFSLHGPFQKMFFEGLLPTAVMFGVGFPVTRWYPGYYQRKLGIIPPGESLSDVAAQQDSFQATTQYPITRSSIEEKETEKMADNAAILALTRKAWIAEMIAEGRKAKLPHAATDRNKPDGSGPRTAQTCEGLLRSMPSGFNPDAAKGMRAVYQFEVSGSESFTAHLQIADGLCTYHSGPAAKPDVIVKTPAQVWLAVSKGEMDGQQAFMSGKYKVDGDLSLLLRLRSIFSG